jgi:hypothetical protein
LFIQCDIFLNIGSPVHPCDRWRGVLRAYQLAVCGGRATLEATMTNTLFARGGALSALALVLALAVTPAAAEAQNRDGPRAERQQMRAERQQMRTESRPQRQQAQPAPQQQRAAQPRTERAERTQPRPDRGGFGADVMRRAERAGEPDARPATQLRDNRPARRAEQVDRRSERRADTIERRSERRADRIGDRGDRRADAVEQRGDRRAEIIGRGGSDWRDGRRNDSWRDGRRDSDGRDGRRDGDWRDGRRGDDWRDSRRDGDWRDGRSDSRRDRRNWRRDDWRWNYRGWNGWDAGNFRRWDNRWRSNRDYDWADYRRGNRFVFRPGPYYAPYRDHRYSRLRTGFFLDSLFFQPRFFINDPYSYRLPPVYGPYQWVRYYDDVLLVDCYTGEVVDVIYDFFW